MSMRKKLEKAMFDYVDKSILPVTYEILLEVYRGDYQIMPYEAYLEKVREKLKGGED